MIEAAEARPRSRRGGTGSSGTDELRRRVRNCWNDRAHDPGVGDSPPGSRSFFDGLEKHRFEKLGA